MTWDGKAECRKYDPELWFEIENAEEAEREPDAERVRLAVAVCASCPVRDACLEDSFEQMPQWDARLQGGILQVGIRGGFTYEERSKMKAGA